MAKATAHPDRRLISSEDVHGTNVYGIGDEAIGEIDHLLIEKISGRVAYAVMSFGGFLGLAHSHYPIPWSALKYDTALQGYRTGITEAQLKDAPAFSDDSWTDRDWETRTHQHYGAPTYWGRVQSPIELTWGLRASESGKEREIRACFAPEILRIGESQASSFS